MIPEKKSSRNSATSSIMAGYTSEWETQNMIVALRECSMRKVKVGWGVFSPSCSSQRADDILGQYFQHIWQLMTCKPPVLCSRVFMNQNITFKRFLVILALFEQLLFSVLWFCLCCTWQASVGGFHFSDLLGWTHTHNLESWYSTSSHLGSIPPTSRAAAPSLLWLLLLVVLPS